MQTPQISNIAALDVGTRRIGVAVARADVRIPRPLTTLDHNSSIAEKLQQIILKESIAKLVIGLPRGLDGQETDQTRAVRDFADALGKKVTIPLHFQDEAVTSQKAEAELKSRGKPYDKGEIDALAATYILEDYFIDTHPRLMEEN